MPLPEAELRRRIVSAATLRGHGLRELRDVLEDYGAPRTMAEAMMRGDAPQSRRNLRDLAGSLGFPVRWFEEPDVDRLLPPAEPEGGEPALSGQAEILSGLSAVRSELEALRSLLERDGRGRGVSGI